MSEGTSGRLSSAEFLRTQSEITARLLSGNGRLWQRRLLATSCKEEVSSAITQLWVSQGALGRNQLLAVLKRSGIHISSNAGPMPFYLNRLNFNAEAGRIYRVEMVNTDDIIDRDTDYPKFLADAQELGYHPLPKVMGFYIALMLKTREWKMPESVRAVYVAAEAEPNQSLLGLYRRKDQSLGMEVFDARRIGIGSVMFMAKDGV
jgi:hypothetical protein